MINDEYDDDEREPLTPEAIRYIIARVIYNANDSIKETELNSYDKDRRAFYNGRKFGYYEVLVIIKDILIAHGEDLKKFGLC